MEILKSKKEIREKENAARNRRELIAAGLSRRELMKMGLLTSAGYLVAKNGLSARATADCKCELGLSPPTRAFIEPLPTHMNGGMVIKQPVQSLNPTPTVAPNTAAGEGRTRNHQLLVEPLLDPNVNRFAPRKLYEVHQQVAQVSVSPDLPLQTMWGFDGRVPGPTYVAFYGEPILVRNFNELPDQNGGFGLNQVTTHLHNGHTPSESDGFPCDWFRSGKFYDQHYPNVLAGFASTHQPDGDPNEAMSTLWYHDHRVEFTSQNVYKGLAGFYLLFNDKDTGNELTGFHLPTFPDYDIPLMLTDKVFNSCTGELCFDLFNLDGILGDKFLVNGKIQPFFEVRKRRYRFRILNAGPSRFYELFLTDLNNLSARIPFWVISNDGNLLPRPVQVTSIRLGVAERMDIIVDFANIPNNPSRLYLENRLEQTDGRGPSGQILPAGRGNLLLEFRIGTPAPDQSVDPATGPQFYALPDSTATPRVVRTFRFERQNGQWAINGRLMESDCSVARFTVQKNSVEHWILQNNSGGWQHPIHIHFEEFQILTRNGVAIGTGSVEKARKDVVRLGFNEEVKLFFRFRDMVGRFPMHCHNTIHEDHAMMLRFDIADQGDTNPMP